MASKTARMIMVRINKSRRLLLYVTLTSLVTACLWLTVARKAGYKFPKYINDVTHDEGPNNNVKRGEDTEEPWFPMAYTAPRRFGLEGRTGIPIQVDLGLLRRLGIPLTDYVEMNKETFDQFVFLTAASEDHVTEIEDSIASIQIHFPRKKILFYDLGITKKSRKKIASFCGVTVRSFNFSAYPDHVKNLRVYAWKILLIQGVLREFPGVFWMDASIRLRSGDLSDVYSKIMSTGGAMQFKDTNFSNFALTHPRTYDYFPTLLEKQKQIPQTISGILLLFRTEFSYWKILHWWFLCALSPDCIAPIKSKRVGAYPVDTFNVFLNCHRFDQALISLLHSNQFGFDRFRYILETEQREKFVIVRRAGTEMYEIKICPSQMS